MVLQKCGIVFAVGIVPLQVIILFFLFGHFQQVRKERGRVGRREGGRWKGGREGGGEDERQEKHRKYSYSNLLCVLHSIVLTVGILLVMESISSAFLQALCLHW